MARKTASRMVRENNTSIFTRIYLRNLWGGEKNQFYSGLGSYSPYLNGYIDVVEDFIASHGIESIVEIGCGDFHVTSKIINRLDRRNYNYHYLGYDVVKPLIMRNRELYQTERVKFAFKDSCTGTLKGGDLLLIRQVLQHLNNKSIQQIIKKFKDYQYVIVTEHQFSDKGAVFAVPNMDKETDADIRLRFFSGVYLDKEPFNCEVLSLMYEMPENYYGVKASINTYLIKGGA